MRESRELDRIFFKLFLKKDPGEVTEEEIAYFRQHPEQIDRVTAPVNLHLYFLWAGALLGAVFVGLSKVLAYHPLFGALSEVVREFGTDIVFEIGVALIGAAVTAYILGILLNQQQDNAAKWQVEIRRRLGQPSSDSHES